MLNHQTFRSDFMADEKRAATPEIEADEESRLRGAALNGPEQRSAVDHSEYQTKRNSDMEVRLDGERDTLYDDGLDVEDEFDTLSGTAGSSGTIP
jgi:hypothetical protein